MGFGFTYNLNVWCSAGGMRNLWLKMVFGSIYHHFNLWMLREGSPVSLMSGLICWLFYVDINSASHRVCTKLCCTLLCCVHILTLCLLYFSGLLPIIPCTDVQATKTSFLSSWRHQMETFSALLVICEGIHRWPVVPLTMASDAELWGFPPSKVFL